MDMLAMKSDRKKGALAKRVSWPRLCYWHEKKIPNNVRYLTDF